MNKQNTLNSHTVFGLNVQSCLALPVAAAESDRVDVTISYGNVPDELPGAVIKKVCSQSCPGEYLLNMPNIARYYVKDGYQIVIDKHKGATEDEVLLFLMGTVFCALLLQKHILPVHGSAIAVNGKAILFCGISGTGKSTLAAAFYKAGYPVLADDLVAIAPCGNNGVNVYPGLQRLKLWEDVLRKLGEEPEKHMPVRPGLKKYNFQVSKQCIDTSLPLANVYILSTHKNAEVTLEELTGMDKIDQLLQHTMRKHQVTGLGMKEFQLHSCAAISQNVRVFLVKRPQNCFLLNELVETLENTFTP